MAHRRKTSRDEQRHLEQASVMQEKGIGRSAAPAMPPQPDVMHISVNQPDDGSASSVSLKVQADAMRRAEEHARQQEQARQQQQAQQQQWPAPEHIISHLAQTGAAGPDEVRFLHHRKHMVDSPASLQLLQSAANDAALRGKRKGSPEYLDHVEKTYRQYAQNLGHQPEIHNQPMQTGGAVRPEPEPEPDVETYPGQHEDERQQQEQQAARVDEIVESELQHEERMKEVASRPDTSRALDLTQRAAADSYRAPRKEYATVQGPVSREVPSASGRRQSHQVKLNSKEVEIAKESGISVEEYARQKKRLASMRANNEYGD